MSKKKTASPTTKTGKRKCAIARVRLVDGNGKITINGKDILAYFGPQESIKDKLKRPFELTGTIGKYDVIASIKGGGRIGQADALMYGIAKILAGVSTTNRANLKAADLMTRDCRIKESKKYGRKKARKRFQFSKR